ncbi:alginate lyase family protein [Psychroserpens ponticola]|uniref:Alginate lyase family protein n=1 Tax=Psychroserpens ponticola TaxID=2932268 RepID=A0ABY7RXG1_9FLAO|nr:alginate lyase family protein [Psychroserpens ponticola]WCO01639.1 alginate lyase family protein [Psychroserpens ponticola]
MSIKEVVLFRLPQFIQSHILGKFQANSKLKRLQLNSEFKSVPYHKNDIEQHFKAHPFSPNFHLFNTEVNIFEVSEWRKDYHNNIVSPIDYYGKIKRQDFNKNGDIKFVAELSRFEFLPFLAFEIAVDDHSKNSNALEKILTDWSLQNPFLNSIHWTSGIEIGIRTVNLIYTHFILNHFDKLTQTIDEEIRQQLAYNYKYLKHHLSLFSSANNHLMAELMGLVIISSYCNIEEKESRRWIKMFYEQIEKQVNNDGVHMELCPRYHAEVTDQVLIGLTFLKQSNHQIPIETSNALKSLFKFTEHVQYYNIDTVFGDNDEGCVINPYFAEGFSLFESQLKTSNHLFNTSFNVNNTFDFRNYLIFGSAYQSKASKKLEADTIFENSGYCFIYDHDKKMKLSIDMGPIGDTISAAHGHSDIFHFNLQIENRPFIIDSGTYQYHSNKTFWRDYFRGITAHNTISVNHKQHATNNGRMSWINCPETTIDGFTSSNQESSCKGTTNAFNSENVIHSRHFSVEKQHQNITIIDTLTSDTNKNKNVSFYLHFHPNVNIIESSDGSLILEHDNKKIQLKNEFFNNKKLVRGDKNAPLGWYSSSFNKKIETQTLVLTLEMKQRLQIETIINYNV